MDDRWSLGHCGEHKEEEEGKDMREEFSEIEL